MKPWTPERRERGRREALERRPWESSTGARSAAGKKKVARNSRKHGGFAIEHVLVRRYLTSIGGLLRTIDRIA